MKTTKNLLRLKSQNEKLADTNFVCLFKIVMREEKREFINVKWDLNNFISRIGLCPLPMFLIVEVVIFLNIGQYLRKNKYH